MQKLVIGELERQADEESRFLGILLGLSVLSAVLLGWQVAMPRPVCFLGITIDRLSSSLTLLVASIGTVTFRYSLRYLGGDPNRRRFLRLLASTVGAAYLLMAATNLLLFFVAWLLTSLGLHGLLTIYKDRPDARRPARKKFLISRLGDLALISAIILIRQDWGTWDLNEFLRQVQIGNHGESMGIVGLLVALAALTKSAQFPFHSWLPETMEAPTPVSALMHAGIINAGGALLLRFAPVIVRLPEVLLLLSLVGAFTFSVGTIAMWAQVKVKRTLAWSTVSQMGFMMVQCGIGAFPAAAIHILGHGCYKAWSFLMAGELPASAPERVSPRHTFILASIGTLSAIPAFVLASRLTGFSPLHSPGELALTAILGLSIGQIWVAILGIASLDARQFSFRLTNALGASLSVALVAFALYRGASWFLQPVLGEIPSPEGWTAWVAAVVPVIALVGLLVLQQLLPSLAQYPVGRAFRTHALHGFYLGAVADRFVDALWINPKSLMTGSNHA